MLEKQRDNLRMTFQCCEMQRSLPVLVPSLDICTVHKQHAHHLQFPLKCCTIQRGHLLEIVGVRVGMFEKQRSRLRMVFPRREMQRSLPTISPGPDICTAPNQHARHLQFPFICCTIRRGHLLEIVGVRVGMLEKQRSRLRIIFPRREMQRSLSILAPGSDICTTPKQHARHLQLPFLYCIKQRGLSLDIPGIRVAAMLEKQRCHLRMTLFRREMQGSLAKFARKVDIRTVFEEK